MVVAKSPRLSFIIPVRDDADSLACCLASIRLRTGDEPIEIIVGDNGSIDGSIEIARRAGALVLEIPSRPVSQVRNLAVSEARGELLAFVDADHELVPGWVESAISVFEDSSIVGAGAPYRAPAPGTWVQRMYDRLRSHESGMREVDWLPGGNLVVRRAAFQKIGGFDGSLETCEDVDLCQRLKAAGGRLVATDGMYSVHRGDPRTLRSLFFGELWRGRDNLRVTLRAPLTLRSLPSLAMPVVNLLGITAVLIGTATLRFGGAWFAGLGVTAVLALAILRSGMLLSRKDAGRSPTVLAQALVVAAIFDTARGLALVSRAGHTMRRKA